MSTRISGSSTDRSANARGGSIVSKTFRDSPSVHFGPHKAADRAVGAATDLLAALDAYDDETLRLRQLVEQMRRAFGSDERVADVESALSDEAARLRATSEAVLAATKWRLDVVEEVAEQEPEPEAVEEPGEEELSQDLQEIAQERRRARIKEYFGKG